MKVLKFINSNSPVKRVKLQEIFGDSVKRMISHLSRKGLVVIEVIDGVPTVSITDVGKETAEPGFCSSCECNPCDCNWGN
jgi:Mn-dependent DtxR family transcriptional regulator